MRISARPHLSAGEKEVIRGWVLGLLRGEESGVPYIINNRSLYLWVEGHPRNVIGNSYFCSEAGTMYVGRSLSYPESNLTVSQEIAVLVALCDLVGIEFDEELERALTGALAKVLAQTWQSMADSKLIRSEGSAPTQLAWNASDIAAKIDGEWVYARTGQLAPVDDTWTQVSL